MRKEGTRCNAVHAGRAAGLHSFCLAARFFGHAPPPGRAGPGPHVLSRVPRAVPGFACFSRCDLSDYGLSFCTPLKTRSFCGCATTSIRRARYVAVTPVYTTVVSSVRLRHAYDLSPPLLVCGGFFRVRGSSCVHWRSASWTYSRAESSGSPASTTASSTAASYGPGRCVAAVVFVVLWRCRRTVPRLRRAV